MALLLVSVVPAAVLALYCLATVSRVEEIAAFAFFLLLFQALFLYARRRCSTPQLSAWDGLLYITAYMTIGVSSASLVVAVPGAIVGVLGLVATALLSLADADPTRAQQRFRSMVVWFGRHRMYQ